MLYGVTGCSGMLGAEFLRYFREKNQEYIPVNRERVGPRATPSEIVSFLRESRIRVLVHCAAITDVEWCESHIEETYLANTFWVENLVKACLVCDIKFVFISSTGIYGDAKVEPYTEYDSAIPTTVHHRSKLLAEQMVTSALPSSLIVRVGWLFGGIPDSPKNFVVNRIAEARASQGDLKSNISQIGNPTYVGDVVSQVIALINIGQSGIFNCVNEGMATRYEYVKAILAFAKLNVTVVGVESSAFDRVAKVSHNETAKNLKLEWSGLDLMPSWQCSLESYISKLELDL